MSLINPFKVVVDKDSVGTKNKINNVVNIVVDELVATQAELITGVQEGIKSRSLLEAEIRNIVTEKSSFGDYDNFINLVFDILFGYGILEPYLNSPEVSDILINAKNLVI